MARHGMAVGHGFVMVIYTPAGSDNAVMPMNNTVRRSSPTMSSIWHQLGTLIGNAWAGNNEQLG